MEIQSINIYFHIYIHNILIYWQARCDCKLWNTLRFYCVFWVFSYIFYHQSCLNCCISTKLSLVVYLIDTDMSVYRMWLQVMKSLLIWLRFFSNFAQNWWIFMFEVLYLHQTFINCVFDVNITISYNKLSDVTASYGTLLDFIAFLRYFHT